MGAPLRLYLIALTVLLAGAGCTTLSRRADLPAPFPSLRAFEDSVRALAALPDPSRTTGLDALWNSLVTRGHVPLVVGDSVAFLYRGAASSVEWHGSFNSFGRLQGVPNAGTPLAADLWILKQRFPRDARVDYWLEVDGQPIHDVANPLRVSNGTDSTRSPSELRMPAWKPSPWAERLPDVPRGTVELFQIDSEALGYRLQYWVYSPPGYAAMTQRLPSLYVTDGAWYLNERSIDMTAILDNLIGRHKLRPLVVVFIDARNPEHLGRREHNRRESEFKMNPRYARFVADELVPHIDRTYHTLPYPEERGILGLSFGGLNAAYFGVERSDTFHKIAMQSPALHGNPSIYQRYAEARIPPGQQYYITTGTIQDTEVQADQLVEILRLREIPHVYRKVNDGHSMPAWRHQLADILLHLWRD